MGQLAAKNKTPPEVARQYLFDYLKDEFLRHPEVRLRLAQDSHLDGVTAKTEAREYFFPTEWVQAMRLDRVRAEVERIKATLPVRS